MPLSLSDSGALRLVIITDGKRDDPSSIVSRSLAAVSGGATMVQLRLKNADARTLVEVARALVKAARVPVIVNDRADVAMASGAAGVHLGADDVPVDAIRAIAPKGFIIGASVGSDAEVANARNADYVGIGPAFVTSTKMDAGEAIGPDGIRRLAALVQKPVVAIGGINFENAGSLRTSGASGIAVVNAVFGSRDPAAAAQVLRSIVDRWAASPSPRH